MKKKRIVGNDIHKNSKPEIPESMGLSIVFGLSITSLLSIIFFPILFNELLIFLLTILLSGAIGYIDDRKKLRSRYKILLTIFTGLIIFLANFFNFINIKSPTIPILGLTRLTKIYPFVVPLVVAVFTNASNMLEGYNGEGSGTSLIALFFLLFSAIVWNSAESIIFIVSGISVLIPFFIYNKFPAKIFPGDVGTLSIGALFACIALLGSLETAVFCVLLIHIFNSFFVISSVRGFLESSEIQGKKSDIILLNDDLITASQSKNAALTLPRLVLAKGPLRESQLVKNFYVISVICGFFSVISIFVLKWTLNELSWLVILFSILIFIAPTAILLHYFPRIRGIISLMMTFLIIVIFLLLLIDLVIMNLFYEDIDLGFIRIPTNVLFSILLITPCLAIWYYATIKYFWHQINKINR